MLTFAPVANGRDPLLFLGTASYLSTVLIRKINQTTEIMIHGSPFIFNFN
jgi:hypothetical protein